MTLLILLAAMFGVYIIGAVLIGFIMDSIDAVVNYLLVAGAALFLIGLVMMDSV